MLTDENELQLLKETHNAKVTEEKKIYIEGVKQNERAKRKQTFVEGKQQAAEASGRKVH